MTKTALFINRPAVDITWRLDGEIISDEYIDVSVRDSVLNVGPGQQLVDTISTLTLHDVSRDFHYKNVSCEAPSGSGGLVVRSATIVVLCKYIFSVSMFTKQIVC